MADLEYRLRALAKNLESNIRWMDTEQPEDVGLMVYFNPKTKRWYACTGTNYAGWHETYAVIQVFLNESFKTLESLVARLEELVRQAQKEKREKGPVPGGSR